MPSAAQGNGRSICLQHSIATYENRLASIEARLSLLTWMLASQYALFASVVWLLLRVAAKVGAL